MSNTIDFILTNAASELISKVLGGKTLNFTRMAVGDGFSYDTTVAKGYTTLVNEVLSLDITKKETLTASSVRVTSVFKNTDTQKEFYYREVGLYAQDPDTGKEVLYAYGNRNDAAELITPSDSSVVTKQLAFIISVGDSAKVTFNVNAGVYALQEDVTTLQTTLHELNSTKANKDEVTNVLTPKGNLAYANLPTTGNTIGWYYYCPDGDGTHGAGNYVWNGTEWYFGGTGDDGYNTLKNDLVNQYVTYDFYNEADYERGNINAIGVNESNSNFWRTINAFTLTDDLYLENLSAPTYTMWVYKYTNDGTFVERTGYETAENNSTIIKASSEYKYRLRFGDMAGEHSSLFVKNEFVMKAQRKLYDDSALASSVQANTASIQELKKITTTKIIDLQYSEILTLPNKKNYESWCKAEYDRINNYVLLAYSSGPDHPYVNKDIVFTKMRDDVIVSSKIIAAASDITSFKPIGIIIDDTEYKVFITKATTFVDAVDGVYVYTSTDLGETWDSGTKVDFGLDKGEPALWGNTVCLDNIYKVDGRYFTLVSWYNRTPTMSLVFYSDDLLTWNHVTVEKQSNVEPCEGSFIAIKDRILCFARLHLENDTDTAHNFAFSYSADKGATWSDFVETTGLTSANASNFRMIRAYGDKIITMYASRQNTSVSGIYLSVSDLSDVYNGVLSDGEKIISSEASANIGYPYIVRTANGWRFTYYAPTDGYDASIHYCKLDDYSSLNYKILDARLLS